MKKRYLVLTLGAIVTIIAIVFSSCKKINESTELGGGLIPPVDNITTFDTSLTVQAFNDTFGLANDSLGLLKSDEYFLGKISNDPLFGRTDAKLFLELKPATFPYVFKNKPDSLRIDSVVLILDYAETYGDTNAVQTVNVYEMDQSNVFSTDSNYRIRENNFTHNNNPVFLGTRTFAPTALRDSVKAFGGDTTNNQLRIKLSNSFGQRLLNYDSTSNIIKGAYASDSVFGSKFRGFALESTSGNAVMGFNLMGVNTKLAIYYKYDNIAPNVDTTVDYFTFSAASASADYVKRDYSSVSGLMGSLTNNATSPDPVVYIQTTPGTFATIKIPGLAGLSNRVIHRAELVMEELYDISDSTFRPPDFLYLDAIDPTIATGPKFRTIPYDLSFASAGELNLNAFGYVPVISTDAFGNRIRTWHFNISRYVQHVLTHTQSVYDLRLFAPVYITEQFGIPPGTDQTTPFYVNTAIAKGRVRLVGNTGPLDPNPHRMRLRIIYSKL